MQTANGDYRPSLSAQVIRKVASGASRECMLVADVVACGYNIRNQH